MESVAYISAVLASLAGVNGNAHAPSVIAKSVSQLHRLNGVLNWLEGAAEAGEALVNAKDVRYSVHLAAHDEMHKLRHIGISVNLFVNAGETSGYPGSRLRLEVPGSAWDSASPLYFTARDAK